MREARFEIDEASASGGMGSVHRARDRARGGAEVALKKLLVSSPEAKARFAREAEALAGLEHPGIVRYVAHGTLPDGDAFLAMEWLEGEDLCARLSRGPLGASAALTLGARLADALGAAHAVGIVHRDVKPANVFLAGGGLEDAKLIDFGIARFDRASGPGRTPAGRAIGTPGYMSPEQARAARDLDGRADLYSLGCLLFECIAGRPPFVGDNPVAILAKTLLDEPPKLAELAPDTPPELEALVSALLSRSPAERPDSAATTRAALLSIARGAKPELLAAASPRTITDRELRLVSVVIARPSAVDALAGTEPGYHDVSAAVLALAKRFGARVEELRDGTVLGVLAGAVSATDQVAAAARFALAARALLGGAKVGLATGRAEISESLPLGDVIDRAAGLMLEATPARVAVCAVTAGLLDARFRVELGPSSGALYDERAAEGERLLMGVATSCVGRERELDVLTRVLAECVDENVGRAVLLVGAPGSGKSRVRRELARRLGEASPSVEVWLGRGDSVHAGSPFKILADALRAGVGITPDEPSAARHAKLEARIRRVVPQASAAHVGAFLGELIGAPPPSPTPELVAARLDPALLRDLAQGALETLFQAEAGAHPLLLVLEDLQWGDGPSVQAIDGVLAHVEAPLFVLATARREIDAVFPALWEERRLFRVHLGDLSRRASEQLAREVLGELEPLRLARIVERAAGNPFFLEELLRAERERGGDALPDTLVAMVQARIEALPRDARRVLRAGSVFGQTFWAGGVARVAGELELAASLEDLVARELVEERVPPRFTGERELFFRHALVREAAYAMLTDEDRALGHRLGGAWLEAMGEPDPRTLADHFARGGEPVRAATSLRRAAGQALDANDLEGALACISRALACGATGELLGELRAMEAEARCWRAEPELGIAAADEALRLVPSGGKPWLQAAQALGILAAGAGDVERLEATIAAVSMRCGDSPEGLFTLARLGINVLFAGRYDLADRVASIVSATRSAEEDARVRGGLERLRGARASVDGDYEVSIACFARAAAAFTEAGRSREALLQRADQGYFLGMLGAWEEAREVLQAARAEALATSSRAIESAVLQNLGIALIAMGDVSDGEELLRASIAAFRGQKNGRMEGYSRVYLARSCLSRGAIDEARDEAERAVRATEKAPPAHADALATLASVRVAEGRGPEALELAARASAIVASLGGTDANEAAIWLAESQARLATGDRLGARELAERGAEAVRARAARIADPARRASFLERVVDNRRLLALAARLAE